MPSTLEKLSPTRVKLTIDMPFAEIEPAITKAYRDIANQVSIPGFRKGKVPPRLIDQRFGRGAVLQEAINAVLPNAYGKEIAENKLAPLSQPEIDIVELNDGENVVFTAEVDVRPDFDVVDPASISVEVPVAKVEDSDVDERVEMLRERFATLTDVDRKAAEGDIVVINLTGRQDGKVLDDAEAKDVSYKVGSGNMIDGIDDAVTGLKAGENATFTSTLMGGKFRGQKADIEVEVIKVQQQELPDVDDEFAQMVSQFDTVDEMRADLRESLERMARLDQARAAREKILEKLVESTEFELPEGFVDREVEARRNSINQQLANAGLTLEQYLEDAEDEKATTPEEFWETVTLSTEQGLRSSIILDKIAEDNEFEITQEDLTQLIFARAQNNGTSPEQEMQHMMEHGHTAEWMGEVRRGKALEKLVGEAQVSDADGNAVDLKHLNGDGTIREESPVEQFAEVGEKVEDLTEKPKAKKTAKKATSSKKSAEKKAEEKPAKKPATKKAAKADSAED